MDPFLLKAITDDEYLDITDISIFLSELTSQVVAQKPENPIEFAKKYFQKVQSCHHVLGSDFSFITKCKHNRRAFVFCCLETFQGIGNNEELTVIDFHLLLQIICPDFPLSLVEDSVYAIDAATGMVPSSSPAKYYYSDLRVAIFFHIIYHDWLRELGKLFLSDTDSEHFNPLSINRLQAKLNSWQSDVTYTAIQQPPKEGIETAINSLLLLSKGSDVTYDKVLRSLFASSIIREDVCTKNPRGLAIVPPILNSPRSHAHPNSGISSNGTPVLFPSSSSGIEEL